MRWPNHTIQERVEARRSTGNRGGDLRGKPGPSRVKDRASSAAGRDSGCGPALLAPMMLESGKFPVTVRFSRPGLRRGSQAGAESVRGVRRGCRITVVEAKE